MNKLAAHAAISLLVIGSLGVAYFHQATELERAVQFSGVCRTVNDRQAKEMSDRARWLQMLQQEFFLKTYGEQFIFEGFDNYQPTDEQFAKFHFENTGDVLGFDGKTLEPWQESQARIAARKAQDALDVGRRLTSYISVTPGGADAEMRGGKLWVTVDSFPGDAPEEIPPPAAEPTPAEPPTKLSAAQARVKLIRAYAFFARLRAAMLPDEAPE